MGLDNAGKEKVMHRIMRGTKETERTPPNYQASLLIEKFAFMNGSSYELLEVGGCHRYGTHWGKSRPQEADFTVVVVDAFDQDRLAEIVEILREMKHCLVDQIKSRDIWILLNKQDLMEDGRREECVKKTTRALTAVTDGWADDFTIRIVDTPGLSALKDEGMKGFVDDISEFLRSKVTGSSLTKQAGKSQRPLDAAAPSDELRQARILEANKTAATSEAFWKSIKNCTVNSWDHYNHLRSGYFVVLDAATRGNGMAACSDSFLLLLNQLREADPKRFPKIPNRTMTTFWLVQLRLAAVAHQVNHGLPNLPSRDDFGMVLLENPQLMDVSLWSQYYSKDVLFSPQARDEWCPPDIKSFPPGKVAQSLPMNDKIQ